MQPLISIHEAEKHLLSKLPTMGSEEIDADQALGRRLAVAITADRAIPPYHRVMMDGIAIAYDSFASGLREFAIAGTQAAGQAPISLKNPETCLEVMTGAVLPEGCDCVIKVEDIRVENGIAHLSPTCPAQAGQHIHPMGSDSDTGAVLVPVGAIIGAPEAAIAASVGQTELSVFKLPKILLITTGDEVIPPAESPQPHQIRRSHAPAIGASITGHRLGCLENIHVPDTLDALNAALQQGMETADLILLTGGISMGKFDYVAPVMKALVGDPLFHGIAQRPGKPLAFWPGETPVIALPGNPVSVMACMARYILPALRNMRGESWQPSTYPLAKDVRWNAPFPGLVASQLAGNSVHAQPPRNSGDYTALAGASGICELAATSPAGTLVHYYPW
ncbi:molybdopterin molybdotransferase MoeA [Verrucomicrobiaceae bacterium 5K15]|uniref:Molybdopterin molybdenumtransferase n=1 Tax=Oceaniferula flava TaxID=2800421 RepID=A0AAE2VD27_9BACT|nr:molybdopterin molybdotransferase MoeA [Oceaniferula flavus]MBK1854039.1 molybdopterin molybdotransferase MoeA [Oceaniferula flavus]MBM1135345.1 molybdopterin molybdotransferase MoeA [Oceaniferula flavus]